MGDRLLVEMQGGLSFEDGAGIDILEAVVLLQSIDHTVSRTECGHITAKIG